MRPSTAWLQFTIASGPTDSVRSSNAVDTPGPSTHGPLGATTTPMAPLSRAGRARVARPRNWVATSDAPRTSDGPDGAATRSDRKTTSGSCTPVEECAKVAGA